MQSRNQVVVIGIKSEKNIESNRLAHRVSKKRLPPQVEEDEQTNRFETKTVALLYLA